MSQYNKTVLTRAGLELAKRANAGQAKFGITRAVTSADDWSHKTVQDLEEVTTIPNIMQQGTIMDTDEVESNNSVIGVSLCFTNKNLSTGYQIRIIGLYVKEEGQENDFLYAVTTAITPEHMPSFADKVLYRFNTQMYLVIGNAQSVNVVINEGTAVTHGQLDKYKGEVSEDLKRIEENHKEDMSHVAKSASVNGGAEILPDSTGKLNLVVPDPDLSKYVSLEQLGELLKAKADKADTYTKSQVDSALSTRDTQISTKANISDVYTKSDVDNAFTDVRGRLGKLEGTQTLDSPDFNSITSTGVYYITNNTPANIKNNPVAQWGVLVVSNGNGNRTSQVYYPDDGSPQWCRLLNGSNWLPWYQLSTKKDASNAIDLANQARTTANTKANASDLAALQNSAMQVIDGNSGDDILSFRDEKIRCYNNAQNVKNLPGMSNTSWFYVITHTKNGWGNVTVISQDNCYWQNVLNGSNWSGWVKHATSVDITDLQNQINANDNGTITTGYDWNTATPTNQSRTLQNAWIVDQSALRGAVDRMNSINSNANGRLSLGGGNMNLRSTINWNGGEINDKTGNLGGLNWAGGSDWAKIYGDQDDNDNLDLAIDLGDDGSNHVSFRKNGSETSAITSDGHFTGTVDWGHVNGRPQDQVDRVNTITPLFRQIQNSNNWNDIFGVDNPNNVLTSIRIDAGGSGALLNNFAAGIGFGGGDTKGVLSVAYSDHQARITGGNGTGPVWSEDIAWKSDVNDLRNQVQQLIDNQFEVQTFTDATAAANWEAQKPGKRMAIVNS